MEVTADELRQAVEHLHQCRAVLREAVPVVERFKDRTVWDGTVHIFDLSGHPNATTCYAWSSEIAGSQKRRFYAVLKSPPVSSPADAVRASIVADHRK
jgi:hypothetical protein